MIYACVYYYTTGRCVKYVRSLNEARNFVKIRPTTKVYRTKTVTLPAANIKRHAR